ncbi:MAG: gliding motility-associated C-terminal domain-containing protein [Chitinophagales bacterium]|nr:gliding motility-associated C-terminal domain-containing protein [Bacteroidota bacterium]MCB9043199.1 gliding motility-associated C-terminal domain-containing protein [Chitinophagales bacterium]
MQKRLLNISFFYPKRKKWWIGFLILLTGNIVSYAQLSDCSQLTFSLNGGQMYPCASSPPYDLLSSINTLGGTFSGNGVVGNTFDPMQAQTGQNIITYTITTDNGDICTPTQTIYVDGIAYFPEIDSSTPQVWCNTDPVYALSSNIPANDPNSTWIIDNDIILNDENLDPSAISEGEHYVSLLYLDPTNGCTAFDTLSFEIFANENPALTADFVHFGNSCLSSLDTFVFVGGALPSNARLSWNTDGGSIVSSNDTSIIVSWENEGVYDISLNFEGNPCVENLQSEQKIIKTGVLVETIDDLTLHQVADISLDTQIYGATLEDVSINWTPADGLSCTDCLSPSLSVIQSATYAITVSDYAGCSASDTVNIVLDIGKKVFVPNAFTPNNDQINDVLMIFGEGIEAANWQIFDRWGQLIFETHDPNAAWDGTYRNKLLSPQVFTYFLEITFFDGETQSYTGNVSLLR